MKIERQKEEFKPITITIDNKVELCHILNVLDWFIGYFTPIQEVSLSFNSAVKIRDILNGYK